MPIMSHLSSWAEKRQSFSIRDIAELANIGTLVAFVLVSFAVIILRRTQPNLRRAFRVPWVPVIPILSMIASSILILNLPPVTIIRFIVWLILGLLTYFFYSRQKSHLQQELTIGG